MRRGENKTVRDVRVVLEWNHNKANDLDGDLRKGGLT